MPYHVLAAFFCLSFRVSAAVTPIQWASPRGEILKLMPKSFSGHLPVSYALPFLTIGLTRNRMVPQYSASPDNAISVEDWCVEVDGKTAGDTVIVDNGNGGSTQQWNWVSEGHGRNMIQLKSTTHVKTRSGTSEPSPSPKTASAVRRQFHETEQCRKVKE